MDISEQFSQLFTFSGFLSVLTLSLLEIVLGIDNLIFISLSAQKLSDRKQRKQARIIGLALALIIRGGMLFGISYLVSLNEIHIFSIGSYHATIGGLIFFVGGLFLVYKSSAEIWEKIKGHEEGEKGVKDVGATITSIIIQIVIIDFVFSFDSILAAVALVKDKVVVMIAAVLVSMIVMLIFSESVGKFINNNPNIKTIALAFILVVGIVLVLEAFHIIVKKELIYVGLAFALFVEFLHMWEKKSRRKRG
jgi:predicted tellurium resistance membrane protein TerC